MIFKLQSPIVIKRKERTGTVQVLCFKCGTKHEETFERLKVRNYCNNCKERKA
jgi:hypothetical protein